MMKSIRTYSELVRFNTFKERFEYLRLDGRVGVSTFGFDRYLNQRFYRSVEWKQIRDFVISRDSGLDLAFPDHEIYDKIIIHHMNPMSVDDLKTRLTDSFLDSTYLISTSHRTHNAIHYGDSSLLPRVPEERRRGDTKLWPTLKY